MGVFNFVQLPIIIHIVLYSFIHLTLSETNIPIATSYRAFGPLPFTGSSLGADPLASIPSKSLLSTLLSLETFPSESAVGGFAKWRSCSYNQTNGVINAPFSDVDPSKTYEAWAVGNFTVRKDHRFPRLLQCSDQAIIRGISDAPSEVPLNETVCSPDIYGDGRGLCSIRLLAGNYNIFVHLAARANHTRFLCNYFRPPPDREEQNSTDISIPDSNLLLQINDTVLPHVIVHRSSSATSTNGIRATLAGAYCSVTLMNTHDTMWATGGVAELRDAPPGLHLRPHTLADEHFPLPRIAPRQIRQLRIDLRTTNELLSEFSQGSSMPKQLNFSITISYDFASGGRNMSMFDVSLDVGEWGTLRAYHFTYIDVDSSVQAAAALPPRYPCLGSPSGMDACPVLLSTHGAGVEATASAWTDSYKTQNQSWVLLPTGRRKFGLNWEGPQMRSAITALRVLADQLPGVPVEEADKWKARKDHWLQAGHSMGGHGALLLATHFPDMIVAALPAMGWLRLSTYDDQNAGEDIVYSDMTERALLSVSSAEFNADMYSENLLGIPFLARVGSDDDNVPPSNLRKFCRLLKQNEFFHNFTKSFVSLSEVPGKGHWFDGVVDDDDLQPFLTKHLSARFKPELPQEFSLFTMNPASSGSRGGLRIMSLEVPFDIGRIIVKVDFPEPGTWTIETLNVRRLRYQPVAGILAHPERILIDSMEEPTTIHASSLESQKQVMDFCVKGSSRLNARANADQRPVQWKLCHDTKKWGTVRSKERGPDNSGPGFQVFSERKVTIVYPEDDENLQETAISLSNRLYIRGISAQVTTDSDVSRGQLSSAGDSNIVLLGGPNMNRMASKLYSNGYSADITFYENTICIGSRKCFSKPGIGVAFLSDGPGRTLLFYAAGTDRDGLLSIIPFIPISPSSKMAEWVVASKDKGWGFRGLGGVVALGYWNHLWKLEARRTYPSNFVTETSSDGMMYELRSAMSPLIGWRGLGLVTTVCFVVMFLLWWKRRKRGVSYTRIEMQESFESHEVASSEKLEVEKQFFIPPETRS